MIKKMGKFFRELWDEFVVVLRHIIPKSTPSPKYRRINKCTECGSFFIKFIHRSLLQQSGYSITTPECADFYRCDKCNHVSDKFWIKVKDEDKK